MKNNWNGRCKCGHLHSEHSLIQSHNYSAGCCMIGGCKCLHFIHDATTHAASDPLPQYPSKENGYNRGLKRTSLSDLNIKYNQPTIPTISEVEGHKIDDEMTKEEVWFKWQSDKKYLTRCLTALARAGIRNEDELQQLEGFYTTLEGDKQKIIDFEMQLHRKKICDILFEANGTSSGADDIIKYLQSLKNYAERKNI